MATAEQNVRTIPARALPGTFQQNADGSLDVKVLVLSGNEMYRYCEGDFVIDLESVALHKDVLIVDYNHEEGEVIGFIGNLRYEDGGLWGDAHLFSAKAGDRAEEVILRLMGGTPYEISPTVCFDESDVENVPEGFAAEVNGRSVDGPVTVFRRTPLRGVSICPYGTDKYTGVTTLKMDKTKEIPMSKNEQKPIEAPAKAPAHPDLEAMLTEFGETDGLKYYREGLSLEDARAADYAQLKAERDARRAAEAEADKPAAETDGLADGDTPEDQTTDETPAEEGAGGEGGDGGEGEGAGDGGAGDGGDGGEGGTDEQAETKTNGGGVKKKEEKEKDGLKAELDALKAELETLKASLRRGEENPVENRPAAPQIDKRPAVFKMADRISEQINK